MTVRYSFGGRDVFLFSNKWQLKWGFRSPCRTLFCPIHSRAHPPEVPAGLAGTGSMLGLLVITGYQVADMDNKGMTEKDIPWMFQNLFTAKDRGNTIKFRLGKNYVAQRHKCYYLTAPEKKPKTPETSEAAIRKIIVMGERWWIKCVCVYF